MFMIRCFNLLRLQVEDTEDLVQKFGIYEMTILQNKWAVACENGSVLSWKPDWSNLMCIISMAECKE